MICAVVSSPPLIAKPHDNRVLVIFATAAFTLFLTLPTRRISSLVSLPSVSQRLILGFTLAGLATPWDLFDKGRLVYYDVKVHHRSENGLGIYSNWTLENGKIRVHGIETVLDVNGFR